MGGTGTAWPEQRIHCVIVKCRGQVDARHGARTIPRMMDCGRGSEHVGAWLLVLIVTLLGEHSIELWSVGLSGSLLAKGANELLLHVTR
jgi:hypothetical protein